MDNKENDILSSALEQSNNEVMEKLEEQKKTEDKTNNTFNKKDNYKNRYKKNRRNKPKKQNVELEPQINPETAKKNTKRLPNNSEDDFEEIIGGEYQDKKANNNNQQRNQNNKQQEKQQHIQMPKIKEIPVALSEDKNKLIIGKNKSSGQYIYLPTRHRKSNLMVLGLANSGKTSAILPLLLNQDFKNRDIGCTIFCSNEEMVYKLFALAKYYKRNPILIKPSTDINILNDFLWKEDYDFNYIKDNINIDFERAINKKQIVIIDMEQFKYRNIATRAVKHLLTQYQLEMYNAYTDKPRAKHPMNYLYVDDADLYIDTLQPILEYGKEYNVATTILLKNRDLLVKNGIDYRPIVESNIRNYIIMNGLGLNDAKYFSEKYNKSITDVISRKNGEIIFEILDESNSLAVGVASIFKIEITILNTIEKNAQKVKKSKSKYCKKLEQLSENLSSNNSVEKDKYALNKRKEQLKSSFVKTDEEKDVFATLKNAKEPYQTYQDNYVDEIKDDKNKENVDEAIVNKDVVTSEDIKESISSEEILNIENKLDKIKEDIDMPIDSVDELVEKKHIPNAIDELNDEEKQEFEDITQKYEKNLVAPNPNKKEAHEIIESLVNSRTYLNPEDIDFND